MTELSALNESEEDLSLRKQYAAQSFMFKAFRCYHLADSYAQRRKWGEALGLLERTGEHVVQALELYREWGHSEAQVWRSVRAAFSHVYEDAPVIGECNEAAANAGEHQRKEI